RTAQVGALVLALVLVPAALAAKGHGGGGSTGTGGTSSISGPIMVTDTGSPGLSFGDTVTFNVSTSATSQPYVNVLCYQNGLLVMNSWTGFFDQRLNATRNVGLYSPSWQSGAADCTAWVDMSGKRGMTQLASTSFHVNA